MDDLHANGGFTETPLSVTVSIDHSDSFLPKKNLTELWLKVNHYMFCSIIYLPLN